MRLEDSDGFVLTTDAATYDRQQSVARTMGAVTFGKGRMSGSGVGITYEQAKDVLVISQQAQVTTRNEADEPVMQFSGGAATLDRVQNRLTLENAVHVVRNDEAIDADRAVASLTDNDDVVRFIELRGNSRVAGGGGGIDAMSARDINLDYTDDGQRLEAVSLDGTAAVSRKGENGAAQQMVSERIDLQLAADSSSRMNLKGNAVVTMIGEGGREGRRIAANSLELDVAPDSTLTRAVGRERVRLDLPAAQNAPGRSILAGSLDGTGKPGLGLTDATFTGDVVFTEEPRRSSAPASAGSAAARTARAHMLRASMANDAVTAATFTTDVSFEEAGLKACAARLEYQPDKGSLTLSGDTAGRQADRGRRADRDRGAVDRRRAGEPADDGERGRDHSRRCRIAVPPGRRPAAGRAEPEPDARTAAAGRGGHHHRGDAWTTKATPERPSTRAAGRPSRSRARPSTPIPSRSIRRTATSPPPATRSPRCCSTASRRPDAPTRSSTSTRSDSYAMPRRHRRPFRCRRPSPAAEFRRRAKPQVIGPQGNLQASGRIDVVLSEKGGDVARIDAYGNVRMEQGQRRASGADHLTYDAATGTYVLTAGAAAPVVLIADCRENRGKKLTFYKSNDTIEIDGERERRVQTGNAGGRCAPAAATP